jgi:hypothetical protein
MAESAQGPRRAVRSPAQADPVPAQEALERLANGESQADVARAYNVDPAAICRLAASGAMPENL